MLSHDIIFKPRLFYQLALRNPGEIVGVAEVLSPRRTSRRNNGRCSALQFWGVRGLASLGGVFVLRKLSSALPVPGFFRSLSTVKRVAKSFNIPYHLVRDINYAGYLNTLRALKPDIVVSFQHQIFKDDLLNLPAVACLNCHPAMLPKYRGVKPIFWAMKEDERAIGVTVHTMGRKIDTGRIVCQKEFPIVKGRTLAENYVAAYELSVDAIVEAIQKCQDRDSINSLPEIPASARYYKHPTTRDVQEFSRKGLRVI